MFPVAIVIYWSYATSITDERNRCRILKKRHLLKIIAIAIPAAALLFTGYPEANVKNEL